MKYRVLFTLAAAAVVAISMGSVAPKPAEAGIRIYIGSPHHCRWKRVHVKVWSRYYHRWVWVWQKRKVCW